MAAEEKVLADLERRISELENERAIRDILTRFGYVMDFGGIDEFVDLFTPDGAIDISMGASYGEHAVSERWEGMRPAARVPRRPGRPLGQDLVRQRDARAGKQP